MTIDARKSHSKYQLPNDIPNIAITDDDKRILLEVYRHDIIDAKTIYTLLSHRSADKISRRLNRLWKARYLHRLHQLEELFVTGGGSHPIAYTLEDRGMALITDLYGYQPRRKRLKERAKRITSSTVLHTLEQSRFLVSMRQSVDLRDDLHFLYPEDIYLHFAPQILERDRLPYTLTTRVKWFDYREEQGTNPDGLFMLYNPLAPEGNQRRCIFLEIDRGTETINPTDQQIQSQKFWERTSILRKFIVYAYAFSRGAHIRQFGIPTFQVLTVTTNQGRVKEMQAMFRSRLSVRPHDAHPNRFLFTDWDSIQEHGADLVTTPVQNGFGEQRSLLL